MNVRTDRFPLMDSLRALAALSIVVFHSADHNGLKLPASAVHGLVQRLDVGVTVFFLISGFLLYRPFVLARMWDEPAPRVASYAWRRFLRIVPAYWVALTITTLWLGTKGVFTPSGIPTYYGFGQLYSSSTVFGGVPQAWTLCVEVTFYAFLPVWALGMRRLRATTPERVLRTELLALAALFVASFCCQIVSLKLSSTLLPLYSFLDQFAVGMAFAVLTVWYEDRERPAILRRVERSPGLPWLIALAVLWSLGPLIHDSDFGHRISLAAYVERHELYLVVAAAMLLPAIFGDPERGLVRKFLSSRALLYMGLISYGIYLWHQAVLIQLARWNFDSVAQAVNPALMWTLAAVLGAVLLGSLSYYLVERPVLRLKRLVPPRRPEAADEAIAEPAPLKVPVIRSGG